MAQQTNLNISPYFDDFDPDKNYHKVLFKPGYPVQARELTGLQSILQNQLSRFGQHFFKEGAKVIPGNTAYSRSYYAVELNNTHLGIPVDFYVEQFVGRRVIGLVSGVTAIVNKILKSENSERGNTTIYVSYISSGVVDSEQKVFLDGESLSLDVDVVSGPDNNPYIPSGESVASTIGVNSSSLAAAFSISNGVYFVRGTFVNVLDETLILDQYKNTPTGRIGLRVEEEIINSDEDETLNDNSKGFNNYSAPGADRLKITCSLSFKDIDDYNDSNFIELGVIRDGVLTGKTKVTEYNLLAEEFARRTYSESGDYTVKPFTVSIRESLNDNVGNNGVFQNGQTTYSGSSPSEDLALYEVSPGKAFVKGYEVDVIYPTYVDAPKPRTTKTLTNQLIPYNTSTTLKLNRVFGAPTIGIGNTYILSLRDTRVGVNSVTAPGKEIGLARVYDFSLESGSYSTSNQKINQWDVSLFDIQTFSEITINQPITLPIPTYIKGKYSGSTAFLRSSVSAGTALTVYEKKGDFVANEPLIFNEDESTNTRVAIAVTAYGLSNVKSVYGGPSLGEIGFAKTFTADTIQESSFNVGVASVTPYDASTGQSTIISLNPLFPGKVVKRNDLVTFTGLNLPVPIYSRVVSVGSTSIVVAGITTVDGVASGALPVSSNLSVTDLKVLKTSVNEAYDETLYTVMPQTFISDVSLNTSEIPIRKSYTVNISGNKLSSPITADQNQVFLPFDEERYYLVRSDGNTEVLTSDRFSLTSGSTVLQINNLGADDTGATLTTTLLNLKAKAKVKKKNRVNTLIIDKSSISASGIGATTLNDGLAYGNYPYGTRVQDEKISLNAGDILSVFGVYESSDTSDASAPKVSLTNISGTTGKTTDLIIGEKIVGSTSGAVAIVAEKINDTQITYLPRNQLSFKEGESITFEESKVTAIVSVLDTPSKNIASNYGFNNGQKGTFYDHGYIERKSNVNKPSRRLKIYFSNAYFDSAEGDIITKNSYDTFDYTKDIQVIAGYRNTDILDVRPKVSNYTANLNARSPFEFLGRNFSLLQNSVSNILASDEAIKLDYSYYLGRLDRIYLSKEGQIQVQYGDPSDSPKKPNTIEDAIEIANVTLPPYLNSVNLATVSFLENKGYRMSDIKKLEDRIKNLEYYTSLSLLENKTSSLFVPDSEGLNRFKSGFFVDNFTSFLTQDSDQKIKNSLDIQNNLLRPAHYTNSIDLMFGPVSNLAPDADLEFSNPEGINIKRSADIITLDYNEVEWLKQTFATRTESITPFLVSFWQATMELTPASDTWVDTARIEAKIINVEGNYSQTVADLARTQGLDPQTGLTPIVWDSWQTFWTGTQQSISTNTRTSSAAWIIDDRGHGRGRARERVWFQQTDVIQDTYLNTTQIGVQTREGVRTQVTMQFDNTSAGDRVVSRDVIAFMRSRNIQFVSKKLKPLTQLYAFFDGVNVTKYCVPKLLEISMSSGTFQVGETVVGTVQRTGLAPAFESSNASIRFRVAVANHQEGPYNAPTRVFKNNPYLSQVAATSLETYADTVGTVQLSAGASNVLLPSEYSSTSTILNVDTYSLSLQAQGEFSGYVEPGMILVGQTSGAIARITNLRLVSDIGANLIGSVFIPNPNVSTNPRFSTGEKVFRITDNKNDDKNLAETIGQETFKSSGTLETVQENIISVRNARLEQLHSREQRATSRFLGAQLVGSQVISSSTSTCSEWYDPLAQSFQVLDPTGVFITSCDIFMQTKDDMNIPLTFQIRTMANGTPTQKVLPFSEVIVSPEDIITSTDGSVPTRITFKAPVYLEGGGIEYAICLASWSTKYRTFVSRVGESDILTQEFISQQPYLGSLFKSQNASTWDASQWEDLKFTLYRAQFVQSGSLQIYNPILSEGNGQVATLQPNSIILSSKQIRVGLGSTLTESFGDANGLQFGNTVTQAGTNATGNYIGKAGIATGNLSIINAGIGYTPSSGSYTYDGVSLTNIVSNGRNLTANVTIEDGVAIAATVANSGSGYQVGDVLGITTIGNDSVGLNLRLSVVSIASTNELILDNVQGDFVVGAGKTLRYTNSLGITTDFNANSGGNVVPLRIDTVTDGLHFVVNHLNHGMHHETNRVTISGVESDIIPTKLTTAYTSNSTSSILVEDSSRFSSFENVGVGTTNPGYLLLGNEVISYTSVSSGSINGITRGSNPSSYEIGTPVYKYELGGVSLRRVNKTHLLSDVTVSKPITFDSYNVKVNMSTDGVDRSTDTSFPKLHFNENKSVGGFAIKATQNMSFEIITPMIQNVTVPGTNVSATLKTISGTSLNNGSGQGSDIPFIDQGYETITLNTPNYLSTPRIVASRINETSNSDTINQQGDRSLNISVSLNSSDDRLSPIIDTQRMSAILTSNRVNNPIDNYLTDSRVNSLRADPHACTYVTREVVLQNPATSLKVLLLGHVNLNSEIRAFYAISNNQNFEPIFTAFPGYDNLDVNGDIILESNNSGLPDKFVPKHNSTIDSPDQFSENIFTVNDLPAFKTYRIKLVLTSTDQTYPPKIQELRVIALA